MENEIAGIHFERYATFVEDTKATNELYDKFCYPDTECYDEYNSELIETDVYAERENAFYAGFHAALCTMLDVLKRVEVYEKEARSEQESQ